MSAILYVAPAGAGKTSFLVTRARALAAEAVTVRVVVATRHQVRAWQRRLAEAGGALGVQVGTFDTFYRQVLRAAGEVYVRLSDPVQYRLLRLTIAGAALDHYAPLRAAPGFVRVVLGLVRELKAGGVFPEALLQAVDGMGDPPRLRELGELYLAYQRHLQEKEWADAAGIGWLAQEALQKQLDLAAGWRCVMVDGFDDLTSVQLAVLRELSGRVDELLIALTGTPDRGRPRAHRRFLRTRERIEERLGVEALPLPGGARAVPRAPALAHLEASLYGRGEPKVENGERAVTTIAATDREGEVRAALRWLKERLLVDGVPLRGAALLARSMDAYRPFVQQIAAEYGVPVVFASGTPLRSNPAVAALLDLIRLASPGAAGTDTAGIDTAGTAAGFPWRQTVEAWRSPYLSWIAQPGPDAEPDPGALDRVARWGSVIGGLDQWREALDRLVDSLSTADERIDRGEEGARSAEIVPDAGAAEALRAQFERFVERVTPPAGELPCRRFVAWIEALIADEASGGEASGDEVPGGEASDDEVPDDEEADGRAPALGVLKAVLAGPPELVERDREALVALKDVLRGLVWAEEALGTEPAPFETFLDDLTGAVNTATYRVPLPADQEALLVADVIQARGVVFDAVAVLGLAEGEFPTALAEDPFLRDADRRRLRDEYMLEVDLSTDSTEVAYFYEAVTRPRRALLLTRPRIADNGAPWQASPFWDEVLRQTAVEPVELSSAHAVPFAQVASWPELLRTASAHTASAQTASARAGGKSPGSAQGAAVWAWASALDAERCAALVSSAHVLTRRVDDLPSPYDGGLMQWGATFAARYGPEHTWSASRLESYRACPYSFYVGSVLRLESRAVPAEGLDARQLGNLYHRLMEGVYRAPAVDDPTDLAQLLEALPRVATPLLDAAPRQEGFRETAWWAQTRREIVQNVEDSLRALDQLRGEYVPSQYEQAFGLRGQPALVVEDPANGDTMRVRGFIDRVDLAPDGRARIIDYKTGGPWGFTARAFEEGKKLQLALYARAAESLGLGEVADGYYWHVRHSAWHLENANRSAWFTLASARDELQAVVERALAFSWEAVRAVRAGQFAPKAPEDGCPEYCPAAGFCWHYEPRGW